MAVVEPGEKSYGSYGDYLSYQYQARGTARLNLLTRLTIYIRVLIVQLSIINPHTIYTAFAPFKIFLCEMPYLGDSAQETHVVAILFA
jgi:hypothetical protein